MIAARIPRDLSKELEDLTKKRGHTVSTEVNLALQSWVRRHAISRWHNSRLGHAIEALADYVERLTGKSWVDDSLTRQVLREHLQELVSYVLSPLSESVAVPADINKETWLVLEVLKHAMSRKFSGMVIIDDPRLATIAQFLSDGLANVETRPELVDRRMRQKGRK